MKAYSLHFAQRAASRKVVQYGLLALLLLLGLTNFPGSGTSILLEPLIYLFSSAELVVCKNVDTFQGSGVTNYSLSYDLTKDLQGCRIKVLDVSKELAIPVGIPTCNPNDPAVWPYGQWGWSVDGYNRPVEHFHRQHAAAFYITKAIAESKYSIEDIDQADVVIVNDYCYWTWWQSQVRQGGPEEFLDYVDTAPFLQKAAKHVLNLQKYNETKGRAFAYLLADPNSSRGDIFGPLVCSEWPNAIFPAVIERGQICGGGDRSGRWDLILPYASTKRIPKADYSRPRSTLLFFRAGCSDSEIRSVGMRMRHAAVQTFSTIDAPDVSVKCKCSQCPGRDEHSQMLSKLGRSKFCLVLPGDTQASRRLTEVVLMGCIPVFIGSPFHALPFAEYVDYNSIGYFFEVKHASWMYDPVDAFNLDLWQLDRSVALVEVDFLIDVYTYLRSVRDCEIKRKQIALQKHRRLFVYTTSLRENEAQAVDVVIHNLCTKIRPRDTNKTSPSQ
ncbi:hypothetical protein KFL_002180040 [Klebsormidium nitens]|uniref:Exostosin GT47 domain-containing protein n=1 Tax=Klebsormidium nitens TaxID=105231 RepID=A0A1Y1I6H7_KLENI|nr:hypothetical protein KFL_002180040 [Klebsormidium nitens]|eukprot:GAQ85029.1 hypothetical protein KFL_002180040 [Klebsormidium nitens]